ncbi:hypothetical protein EG19_06820 [Thermoanaerobaculum aquaticum]|uniref:Uncharacterized protein n=1 Tax=Thermoanaerobaculum aquaticum TaxID=1312852 RepID=A0A062XQU6_9BACT|nr:hypothetical protein [Thermoanaerobaculum aquaticum]KDA53193.1 hypothetical protein EG19_06820 [Thermoanaerobaculum aquaticum]
MPKLAFVLFQSEALPLARAAQAWLINGWGAQKKDVCCRTIKPLDRLATDERPRWVAAQFRDLAGWIEREADQRGGPAVLRDAVGLVDFYDASCATLQAGTAQIIGQETPMVALASLLILVFPEIHWLPYVPHVPDSHFLGALGSKRWPDALSRVAGRNSSRFPALFDPSGLRETIRDWLRNEPEAQGSCDHLPRRRLLAAAVDEEEAYAAFNAFVAYRFGYRSLMITSESLLRATLGKGGGFEPNLTFEDLYLGFPDRSGGHLSALEKRDESFQGLEGARRRVFVTVGHTRGTTRKEIAQRNRQYLRASGFDYAFLIKPLPGLHRTWAKAQRPVRARKLSPELPFCWPPEAKAADEPQGHSSPGRLLSVAEILIARAAKLLGASNLTVVDAIHAATLALEAKELLGGKTPTVALDAISLQHEGEVVAESLFLGVEYNLDLKDRFREIEQEVKMVARWFHPRTRRRSELNARLTIIERLAKRFSDLHQVEEEMACLAEARRLRFDFWVRERWYRWPLWLLLRYVAFALSSLTRFVVAVVAWIFFFGVVHYLLHMTPESAGGGFVHALASSAYFFMTLQPCEGISHRTVVDAVLAFQGCVAFLNLGLLISHLYLTVSRR